MTALRRCLDMLGRAALFGLPVEAIRKRPQRAHSPNGVTRVLRELGRSVHATPTEAARTMPGDRLIERPNGTLTHAITIRRPPHGVWPWLAHTEAGSRAGWYSYDFLANAGQPSAALILPELQRLWVGMILPALTREIKQVTLLAFEPERFLIIRWSTLDNTSPLMTWAFILEEAERGATRLIVRVRVGPAYDFHGLPWWLSKRIIAVAHFVMQRKQLLGIARRAELSSIGDADEAHQTLEGKKAVA